MNQETHPTETQPQAELAEEKSGRASYSPEDNKIRLYVGRVSRPEFLKLRADGWITLHKQREAGGGDFAATWSPSRLATALEYADMLEDEDMGPEERAADRAERFGDYRDKRTSEATGHADRYDAQPSAHGYQNAQRAERAAARHDRIGDRAGDAWSKAEYWQRRTAGVIAHALYKSSPGVRMGRIKLLEAAIRKSEEDQGQYAALYNAWRKVEAIADQAEQTKAAATLAGHVHIYAEYMHPRLETVTNARLKEHPTSLFSLLTMVESEYGSNDITGAEACALFFSSHQAPCGDGAWATHYRLRLAYELQMLEAQGGRAAFVEMVPGGYIGGHQIRKVNKSNATGRVVSVEVMGERRSFTKESGYKVEATRPCLQLINVERLQVDAYRPPTPEDLAKLAATKKAEKAAQPVKAACPLVNPTEADAERLQAIWNARAKARHVAAYEKEYGKAYAEEFKAATITKIKQATYSANSQGSYAKAETKNLCALGTIEPGQRFYGYSEQAKEAKERGPALCKLRVGPSGGGQFTPPSVVVLTDKPQKPFPSAVWEKHTPKAESVAEPEPAPVAEPAPQVKAWACACGYTAETSAVYDAKICPDCGSGMFSARDLAATV